MVNISKFQLSQKFRSARWHFEEIKKFKNFFYILPVAETTFHRLNYHFIYLFWRAMQGQKYSFSFQEKFGRDVRQMLNTKSSAAVQKICLKKKKNQMYLNFKKKPKVCSCASAFSQPSRQPFHQISLRYNVVSLAWLCSSPPLLVSVCYVCICDCFQYVLYSVL